jgi:hypothetical protein
MNYRLLHQLSNELLLFLMSKCYGLTSNQPFSKGTINFRSHLKKRKSPLKTVTPSQGFMPDKICGPRKVPCRTKSAAVV